MINMNKSFTLIEILVVIVVIGVLSAFILVGMSSITSSANIARGKAFLNSMDNSLLLSRVSQWKLDEAVGSGTASDSWGTNTGTLSGTAPLAQFQTTGCTSNNCLSFDGNDYIDLGLPTAITSLQQGSVSMWFKPTTDITNEKPLFHIRGTVPSAQYVILEYRSSKLKIDNGAAGSCQGNTTLQLNTWYNVVYASNGSTWNIYLNGIAETLTKSGTDGCWFGDVVTPSSLSIGGYATSIFHTGLMDDVRIYNQAIPTSKIQQSYFVGLNNLYKNKGLTQLEYSQRIVELKNNLVQSN